MRSIIPRTRILGLGIAALALAFAEDSDAHPHHEAPAVVPASVDLTAPSTIPAVDVTIGSLPIEVFTRALGRCTWQADARDTDSGATVAFCPAGTAPITSAVSIEDYEGGDHHHLVNLSPGVNSWAGAPIDGLFDGEGLSDSHPQSHGEPPPDLTTVASFTSTASGSGTSIHYNYTGTNEPNDLRTLCCESLEQRSDLDELENCRYESELVPVEPESDPDLAGQYVATLACSGGRHVTSGGCHAQFLHDSEWGLTGSHPYVNGDTLEHPDGAHATTPGETGWACRLDREPFMWAPPTVYEEGIGITVLCCY